MSEPQSTSFTIEDKPATTLPPIELLDRLGAETSGKQLTQEELDAKLKAAEERRNTRQSDISERARAEVEHAKAVAAANAEAEGRLNQAAKEALDQKLAAADSRREAIEQERVSKLETHVKSMKDQVSSAETELKELEARLAAAEERRKALEDAKIEKARSMQ